MKAMTLMNYQRGLAFSSLLIGAILLIFAAILGMKVIPPYMEEGTIQHVMTEIVQDPDMQSPDIDVASIRNSFDKRAIIQNITAISSSDLIIDRRTGSLILSAAYQVKIPLFANVSLLLDFNPTSAHR
jgi:Domain of unknown function (DUF4845)